MTDSLSSRVFAFLKDRADEGSFSMSYHEIAGILGCQMTGVRSSVRMLERNGHVAVRHGNSQNPNLYRILVDYVEPPARWSQERQDWLEARYPHEWTATLVAGLNALPGLVVTADQIKDYAGDRGWKKTPELMATRPHPIGRPKVVKPVEKPKPIARREAPKPLVKAPSATQTFSPRQSIFHGGSLVPKCAFHGCPHPPAGRWCEGHTEAIRRPAGEIVAALEAVA